MKIGVLQLNYTVADLAGNSRRIIQAVRSLLAQTAVDVILTSELSLMGYPPKDLLLNTAFVKHAWDQAEQMARELNSPVPLLVGLAVPNESGVGKPLYNAAVVLQHGVIGQIIHKSLLPTYDVFDEARYFQPGVAATVLTIGEKRVGVTICEDIWNDQDFWNTRRYEQDPIERLTRKNVDLILNMSASPFAVGKQQLREEMLAALTKKYQVALVYVNQVGGNDDLVFDGRSCAMNADGQVIARAKGFTEDCLVIDICDGATNTLTADDRTEEAETWQALVLGTRDYVLKSGFSKAVLGLSGGIDSAVTATIAATALGKENVLGVLMPSPYSSEGSITDAMALAKNLGIETKTIPITPIMESYSQVLNKPLGSDPKGITDENLQTRIRGNILMALANTQHSLLLSTGNKSELAVGYCTIYGDMAGALVVLADVYKTRVYQLAHWINAHQSHPIPQASITKAPSAELALGQKDQDVLPPYQLLDDVLERMIEKNMSIEEIVLEGFSREAVARVWQLLEKSEFKRKQAPPGIKITNRAFGSGWRMPMAKKKM